MKLQLIMLDTPIIVSGEEIKEGDAYCTKYYEICKSHNGSRIILFNTDKKIITGLPELPVIDFSALSEEDCNRIGFIDVEKLAVKESIKDKAEALIYNQLSESPKEDNDFCAEISKDFWVSGFQAAQKLNEKKFSEAQVRSLVNSVTEFMSHHEPSEFDKWFEKKIKLLQQPKVFDIAIELEDKIHNDVVFEDGSFNKNPYYKIPKITNNKLKIIKIL